ncbi:MAG TPA: FAD-binding and (Fe-S)-binding domain-containing protein [Rhodanobacteraceae bacterium]|nr:FAD-binding and (Fe-S)-binding domain-containing protein [Rhodanobacteraceae bacterium]
MRSDATSQVVRSRDSEPQPAYTPALVQALHDSIDGEVRFDAGTRGMYAVDSSNYRQVPIGVVIPRTVDAVVQTIAACRRFGAPVVSRGGGTSLCGQTCNVAVVIDFSKYLRHIVSLDAQAQRAEVLPGLVLDDLRDAAEEHHLTFAPDPSTHNHNTLGGMIGNNSCGVHSLMAGKTVDNIESLDILTYDGLRMRVGPTSDEELEQIIAEGGRRGEIYSRLRDLRDRYADRIRDSFPAIPRRVSGYNLDQLLPESGFNVARALVGTEGTCVTVLQATCRLVPSPPSRSLLVLGYPDVYSAGDHVSDILEYKPIGLEGIDDRLVEDMKAVGLHPEDLKLVPDGNGWLLVEFGGQTKAEADSRAHQLMAALKSVPNAPSMKLFDDPAEEKMLWTVRRSGLGATAHVPNKAITWEGWEDASVPPDRLGDYLRDFRQLLEKFHYACDLYGHFGQGCVHTRIDFGLETAAGIEKFHDFLGEAADLVVSYGGSLSGEHGDGQSKAEFLPRMFGEDIVQAFREFKRIWDPDGRMNPGKVVDPYLPTENLRIGTDYNPAITPTHFRYPKDSGNFARASLRCVGVGDCRRHDSGTMCPSYMVTREELHSTRGRARMLFEMLKGDVVKGGWRSKEMRAALDLCLACKGCKGDCPVNVDMATYKAEFLSHHYAWRLRPRAAYAMGLIYWWARLASLVPRLANGLAQTQPFAGWLKALGGIAPQRAMPRFAARTLRQRLSDAPANGVSHEPRGNGQRPRLILWPDTFTNHFLPEAGEAAAEVLRTAGWQVTLPPRPLCCGRPLYDFGMLTLARRQWRQILSELKDDIEAGTPLVGLEPSCVAAFRDELVNLFYGNEDAKRLSRQTFTLAEFLLKIDYRPPELNRKALVQGHCNHKAVMHMDKDVALLKRLGLDFEVLDSGCCGLAGSFGFEAHKYDVSMQIGERRLFPAVRQAAGDTLIIADGFSCREQIRHATGRTALHLAQVLQMALQQPGSHAAAPPPAHIHFSNEVSP